HVASVLALTLPSLARSPPPPRRLRRTLQPTAAALPRVPPPRIVAVTPTGDNAMLTARDIGGMMAMMPAFATDAAGSLTATDTVSVERLRAGLDRMGRGGPALIATPG